MNLPWPWPLFQACPKPSLPNHSLAWLSLLSIAWPGLPQAVQRFPPAAGQAPGRAGGRSRVELLHAARQNVKLTCWPLPLFTCCAAGMYYGGEPVAWTSKPGIPHEARCAAAFSPCPLWPFRRKGCNPGQALLRA